MAHFEDLEVWKRSARLSAELYKSFSDLQDFGFKDQITRSGMDIGMDIGYIDQDQGKQWIKETKKLSRMLHGLIKSIRSRHN